MPHIDTIRKNNEIQRKRVMQAILIVASFSPNKKMPNESGTVFSELNKIEDFHIEGCIFEISQLSNQTCITIRTSEITRQILSVSQD